MKPAFVAALASALLATSYAMAAPPSPSVAGFWQEADDDGNVGAWFYFVLRDGVYEGRLVKMFKPPGDDAPLTTCSKCEGDQKDAPMMGLTIVKGMHRNGTKYDEGSILDPRDGTVYHAQMELAPDGQKLSVRGYVGVPLLGKTQVWTRLPDDAIAPADIPKESLGPDAAPPPSAAPPAKTAAVKPPKGQKPPVIPK